MPSTLRQSKHYHRSMRVEDEHLDVLQNIEFFIVAAYRDHPEIRDYAVMRVLDALVDSYRAEARGRGLRGPQLSPVEAQIFDHCRQVCQFWLGRAGLGTAPPLPPSKFKSLDQIFACLKRIRKSVDRWNKSGGQRGYLTFVSEFTP